MEEIYKSNPNAKFLIYSSLLSDERLKSQLPKTMNKKNIMWVSFPNKPKECEIQIVLQKILNLGLDLLPPVNDVKS
ncbi:MAG: hypothetical protein GY797_30770 [Deltaproteobacteria bacterium]|nr:hypothetical protein [Deltaproteobacteria bacterium]